MNIIETTAPRSDQQNYDDVANSPRVVTVTEVKAGSAEQPVEVHVAEYPGRPYKPSKSMRRVLVAAWGPEASEYVGRRIKLVGDPSVRFGSQQVGGIKIEALSHIDKRLELMLTASKGKRAKHVVEPLIESAPTPPQPEPLEVRIPKAVTWFAAKNVPTSSLEAHVGRPVDEWTDADLETLTAARDELVGGAA